MYINTTSDTGLSKYQHSRLQGAEDILKELSLILLIISHFKCYSASAQHHAGLDPQFLRAEHLCYLKIG